MKEIRYPKMQNQNSPIGSLKNAISKQQLIKVIGNQRQSYYELSLIIRNQFNSTGYSSTFIQTHIKRHKEATLHTKGT